MARASREDPLSYLGASPPAQISDEMKALYREHPALKWLFRAIKRRKKIYAYATKKEKLRMSNLYIVRVFISGRSEAIELAYKSEASMQESLAVLKPIVDPAVVLFVDDFSRKLFIDSKNVLAIVAVNYAEELNLNQEIALLQAHAQSDLQRRAQQDEKLQRAAAINRMNQGSPLVMPGRN